MTAYLSQLLKLEDPFAFWRSIPMPGWACIDMDAAAPKLIAGFERLPNTG